MTSFADAVTSRRQDEAPAAAAADRHGAQHEGQTVPAAAAAALRK